MDSVRVHRTLTIGEQAMQYSKTLLSALATAALALTISAPAAGGTTEFANGTSSETVDDWRDLPVAKANPSVAEEVITSLPEEIQQSDVHIDESYEPGQLILDTEGVPIDGQDLTTRAWPNCTLQAWGPPGSNWGATSTCGVAVFGHRGYNHGYSWARFSDTYGCVQFRGYNSAKARTWYTGGCGSFNSGVSVPWGNVLGNPAARAYSQSFATGWLVDWQG